MVIVQYHLVDSIIFFPLHNCSSMNANLIFSLKGIGAGKMISSRQETVPERIMCLCLRERSAYASVIMNVRTMCRHASVSAWVCACMRVGLCGNFNSMKRFLPLELKLLAQGFAGPPKPLDREAPDCCDCFQRIFCGHYEPFWLLRPASQLQALWQRPRPRTSRLRPVCRLCHGAGHVSKSQRGQVAGSNRQLFFPARAFQTANPFSGRLLSQNAQAHPTQGLGPTLH